ncbi:Bug family tripartite tricarboxylate transporter substrate binding protein [Cupriavidus sp. NPDC089707]|uniref:Bug family tripartite tricarboxylate transporter substrate binding protein n=1 Tax=Cupriavidus sp. NPDC089707 TaxID=3363963 RepID=UPI00381E83AF
MDRRRFNQWLGLGAIGAIVPRAAFAASGYPERPVTMIVPYPAGGPSDTAARRLTPELGKRLGQPVVIDNAAGAGGALGAQKFLRSAADGITLFYGSPNETILAPLANPAVRYKSVEFRLASLGASAALVLCGHAGLPADSIDGLVALGRKTDKPLSFGSVGVGSLQHLACESIRAGTGMKMLHVPYKGAAPALNDLLGGQVDLMALTMGASTVAMIASGKLKCFGVMAARRDAGAPSLPTINEGQYLKDVVFEAWGGVFVPAKTPDAIVEKLNASLAEVYGLPSVRALIEAGGVHVPPRLGTAEAARFFSGEAAKFQQIAKNIDLSA